MNFRLRVVVSLIASILPAAMLMFGAQTSQAASAIWNLNPASGDWNTAANWTPATVPNGSADTAIFGVSNTTSLSLSANTEVDGIVFTPGASGYGISVGPTFTLTISGVGITNNSGMSHGLGAAGGGTIVFSNNSTAGTAGLGTSGDPAGGGMIVFLNNSTAGNATIYNDDYGATSFQDNSTAGNATIYDYGATFFQDNSTAGNATIYFIHVDYVSFRDSSTAGNATIFGDGYLDFSGSSSGGTSRIDLVYNPTLTPGLLNISSHDAPGMTVGSIEGGGFVLLGANNLTVGSNNLSTIFSGYIYSGGSTGGSLTKIGSGTLTFQDRATNDYIANTVSLNLVSGSIINLNYSGAPDPIRSLTVDGVAQVPGVYGSAASGAPHQLPQLAGMGTVQVTMLAASRKSHGAAGTFDVPLPLGANVGIECRSGGANHDYQVVVSFASPVTVSTASVTAGTGSVSSATGSGTDTLIVNLTGVSNAQTITITLADLNDGISTSDVAIPMAVLAGDTNGDGFVNAGDTLETRNRSGQVTNATNFYSDVNLDGFINSGDATFVRRCLGTSLP